MESNNKESQVIELSSGILVIENDGDFVFSEHGEFFLRISNDWLCDQEVEIKKKVFYMILHAYRIGHKAGYKQGVKDTHIDIRRALGF